MAVHLCRHMRWIVVVMLVCTGGVVQGQTEFHWERPELEARIRLWAEVDGEGNSQMFGMADVDDTGIVQRQHDDLELDAQVEVLDGIGGTEGHIMSQGMITFNPPDQPITTGALLSQHHVDGSAAQAGDFAYGNFLTGYRMHAKHKLKSIYAPGTRVKVMLKVVVAWARQDIQYHNIDECNWLISGFPGNPLLHIDGSSVCVEYEEQGCCCCCCCGPVEKICASLTDPTGGLYVDILGVLPTESVVNWMRGDQQSDYNFEEDGGFLVWGPGGATSGNVTSEVILRMDAIELE